MFKEIIVLTHHSVIIGSALYLCCVIIAWRADGTLNPQKLITITSQQDKGQREKGEQKTTYKSIISA